MKKSLVLSFSIAALMTSSLAFAGKGGNVTAIGPTTSVTTSTSAFKGGHIGAVNNSITANSGNTLAQAPAKSLTGNVKAQGMGTSVSLGAVTGKKGVIDSVTNGVNVNSGGVEAQTY